MSAKVERRRSARGPATTLRVAAGTAGLVAPFALGVLGHSPWKAVLLVPALAGGYALGRPRRPGRGADRASPGVADGVLGLVAVHLVAVASLYLAGLALGALFADALPVDPLGAEDLVFVAIVWAVALGAGAAAAVIERRRLRPATPSDA